MNKNDLYNLDITLSKIITEHLKEFKKLKRHAIIYPENAQATEEDQTNWLLDELIWTFQTIAGQNHQDILNEEMHRQTLHKKMNNQPLTYIEELHWNAYQQQEKEKEERITRGLTLFSKYFRMLWD